MNSSRDSDLLKIRQMGNNNPTNLREIAVRIYDKKLKSFLALETKGEVLESCQELLINKTVDYMNVITELQTGQLKSLNSLNDLLCEKSNTIGNLNSTLSELKESNKEQSITITFLSKDIQVLRKEIYDIQIKLEVSEERLAATIQENDRKTSHLKSEFYEIKSNLERENKELTRELSQKVEENKSMAANFKSDMAYLKAHQEREVSDIKKKHKEILERMVIEKDEVVKDKRYLQDLIEVKEDEIRDVKRERASMSPKKWVLESGGKIDILITPIEQPERTSRTRPRSRSRVVEKGKKQEVKKGDKKKEKEKQMEKEKEKVRQSVQRREIGTQTKEPKVNSFIPVLPSPSKVQCSIQTMIQNPIQDTVDQTEIRLKSYLDEQYKKLFDQKTKQLNKRYAEEYKKALNDAKSLLYQTAVLTKDQIRLSNTKFLQMEQMYQQRPSREEDLEYIASLIIQNKSLMGLCNEANQKTDSAYVALQEYHCKLQSYKKLVPMNINGTAPPHMHSTREIITKAARSQSIKPFTSHNSWMMSEPNTSRRMNRTFKHEEQTFDLTKDILATDFEASDISSPLKRKHLKLRPQTSNVLSLKRKSVLY